MREDGQVLLIEVTFVQAEVLMVKVESFVLLVNLLGQTLTERLDLLVQGENLVFLIEWLLGFFVLLCGEVGCAQRLRWLFEPGEEVVGGLGANGLLRLISRFRACLGVFSKTLLAEVLFSTVHSCFEDNFESSMGLALFRQRCLGSDLCLLEVCAGAVGVAELAARLAIRLRHHVVHLLV